MCSGVFFLFAGRVRHTSSSLVTGVRTCALPVTARAGISTSILDRIGDTPLCELRNLVPPGSARILVKLESQSPTGSMKDRMALAIVEAAERDGRLSPGGRVVEYTGGSTDRKSVV